MKTKEVIASVESIIDCFEICRGHKKEVYIPIDEEDVEALKIAIAAIEKAPSVTPSEKVGRWYKKPHEICYTCDQCRTTNASGTKYNFCPHCGARMIEDVENTVQIHGLTFKKEHKTVGEHLKGGENE